MRNHIRTLCAALVALTALVFTAQIADADSMEEITVAHRGAATSQFGEGTLPAYRYAVKTMRTCWTATFAGRRTAPTQTNPARW